MAALFAGRFTCAVALVCAGLFAASPAGAQEARSGGPTVVANPEIARHPSGVDHFALLNQIGVSVMFSRHVTVTGTPRIALDIGGATRYATFQSAAGPLALFRYVVQAGDQDTDGIDIVANSLELNGGTITGPNGVAAVLDHPSQSATATRRPVDGVAPSVTMRAGISGFLGVDARMTVVVGFSESVSGLTADDFVISNGTVHDLAVEAFIGLPNSVYSFLVSPDGEGPLTLSLPAAAVQDGVGNGNSASAQIRVLVGDPATVTVTPSTSNTAEGRAVVFALARSKDNGERTIQVEVSQDGDYLSGGTSFGGTFTATPATLSATFAAGATTTVLTFDTDNDYVDEADGSVTLTVLPDPTEVGYLVGTPSAAAAPVRDNDEPLSVAVFGGPLQGQGTAADEGETIYFRLVRSRIAGTQALDLQITAQGDFLASSHPSGLTIPADGRIRVAFARYALSTFVLLNTVDDTTEEDDGSVTLTMLPRPGDPLNPVFGEPAAVTVRDDDAPPAVTVSADAASVAEGEQAGFTISRGSAAGEHDHAVTVQLEMTPTGDFGLGSRALTVTASLAAGATSASRSWKTSDDLVSEADGAVTLRVLPPAAADAGSYRVGAPASATVAVVDDEPTQVSVAPVAESVTEGADALFRFTRVGGGSSSEMEVGATILGHRKIMSDATRAKVENAGTGPDDTVTFAVGATEAVLTITTEADSANEGDGQIQVVVRSSADYQIGGAGSATVLVEDDDIPEVSLRWISPPMTVEDNVWVGQMIEGQDIDYEVLCSGNTLPPAADRLLAIVVEHEEILNHPVNVNYGKYYRGRYPCADHSPAGFGPVDSGHQRYTGPANGEITVDLLPQALRAPDSVRSRCYLDSESGTPQDVRFCPKYTLGDVTSARITVLNRNPTITVEAVDEEVDEGEAARFRLTRIWAEDLLTAVNPSVGLETLVDIEVAPSGSIIAPALPDSAQFLQGETEVMIEVPTVRDYLPGDGGELILELRDGSAETQVQNIGGSYEVYDQLPGITPAGKSSRVATVRVANVDVMPLLSVPDAGAEEGDQVEFVAALSATHDQPVSVDWTPIGGTAEVGNDYSAHAGGTLSFAVGETVKTINVQTTEDSVPELEETFRVSLTNPVQVVLPAAPVTGTITDDDELPVVTIKAERSSILEGRHPKFAIIRQGLTDGPLDVTISLTRDGVDLGNRQVQILTGASSRLKRVWHQANNRPEDDRVYRAEVVANSSYTIGIPSSAQVTVIDDDTERLFEIGGGATPSVYGDAGTKITLAYYVYNYATVPTGAPVTLHSKLLGAVVVSEVPLLTRSDDAPELAFVRYDREYTVTQDDVDAGVILEEFHVDDGIIQSPRVGFSASHSDLQYLYEVESYSGAGGRVDEARGTDRVIVKRLDTTPSVHTVQYFTEDVSATAGQDYTSKSGTLTFQSGTGGDNFQSVYVPITDDDLDEPYEHFRFVVADNDDATLIYAQGGVPIEDDDPSVEPKFNVFNPRPREGQGHPAIEPDGLRIKVFMTKPGETTGTMSGHDVEFSYETVDATATAGQDYTATTGRATIQAGQTQFTFWVPIIDDAIDEPQEEFRIRLTEGVHMDIPSDREYQTIQIEDNDDASGEIALSVAPAEVGEGIGAADITVTATFNVSARTSDTEVAVQVAGGTATVGGDFTAVADFTLTIPAHQVSGAAAFTFIPIDDGVPESALETAFVTGTASGFTVKPAGGAELQIRDDDQRGVLTDPPALTVDEGQTGAYIVALTSQPTGDVTVNPSVPAGAAVTVSPASLTFSATAWNTAQTVTVTPVADADAEHEQAIISHGVAGADYGSVEAGQVTATVRDDETPSTAITLRADPASVAEAGGSRAVTVTAVLDQAPLKRATTVRVAVADDMATGGADFTAVGTFDVAIAAGAASGTGSFTLSPIDDDLDEDDETLSVDGQVAVDGAPDPGALPVTGAAVTIVDDDSRGVALSDTVLRFEEGVEQAAYTIALTSAPSHDVTVAVVAPASSDLVVSPTHYYFSDSNWSDAQTVRVAAPADADLTDDEDTLTHQVTGGDYAGIAVNDVAVTVTEPTATQASVRDARGSEGSGALAFEVVLDKPIKVPAVISLYHTEDSTATVGADYLEARGSLTFAPGETRKAITVTLVDDALNEAEERVLLELLLDSNLAPPGETTGMATAFGIVEDDDPLPVVSVVGSAADGWSHGEESDGFLSYKVRLDAPSAREVTVDYATSDQAPGGRSFASLKIATAPVDYAPLAGRLTFAAGETERRLTVAVNDDKVSEDDEVFALQLSNPRNAVLSNQGWGLIRDEDPRGVVLTPPSLTLDEGEAGTYTLALSSQPTDAVTAALTTSGGVTAAPQSLSFTTTDWSTAQTVTVTAQDDDDAVDGTAAVRHAFTGGDYDGRAADDLPVTIRDGDTQGVVLSPTALAVDEGQSAPYTVALASQPTADVTVAIGGMVGTDVSAGPSSLTFTASTWRTAQTVTVRAADDADGVQDQVSLTHTAAGGDYVAVSENLTVTVTDSDTVGLVLSEPTLAVTEDAMASYTVKLATQPAAAVTVTIGGATGTDLTAAPATLTFAAQSWNTAQTVQVTAAKDADAVADEATLTHTAAGGDYVAVSENLTVTVTDIDTAGLVLSETALAVTEDDKANYTVKLASEPTAEVTVTIGGTVDTDLAVTPAILTFTASKWQSAQTVEVAAGKDADSAADEATLTHTAAGGDYVAVSENLTVTVTDIDTAGLVLSETALAVTEDDKASYTVKLASEPTAQVTVTIGGITDTDLTVVPASLTFTASEWQTAQTVEVTAAEDADAVTDAATLSHTAGGGDYGSVSKDLPVTVTEIHTAGLVLSETALTVTEGDKASYTVQLASEPTAQVTVTIAGTTGTDLTVAPASLTFTVSEWQTVQTVEVTAAEDADAAVDKPTLSHTAGGGDYGSVSKDLPVTVTELDNAGIVLSHAQLSVTEGAAAAYTVQLASEPTAEVTVTVGGAAGTDLTVDEASLTFTAATWSTAQTVEVTAGEDADAVVDAATLTHAAAGGDYGAVTRGLPVTVTEIHRVGIALTPASLTVTEGAQELYAVALTSEPTAVVTVTIGGMEGTDLEPNKTSLTFTPSGWSTGQTVTVDAGDDADAVNDSAALTHSAAGGDYGAVSRELTVTVTDTDTASTGITLAVAPGSVGESGAATSVTVTGTLSDAAELTDTTVTVTVGASNDGAIEGTDYGTVADLTLTIAAGATSGTATFTLTPTGDEVDEEDETVTVGGAADGFTVTAATVTITDDDTRGIALSPATLSVTEGGEAGYTVALQSEPTGEVTVTVGGTTNTDLSVEPAALTFSTTGWSTAQTVTVDAGADPDAVTDTAPLTHTGAGGDYGTVSRELTVTVTDTDTASTGITLAAAPASVGESAAATSVTVTGTLSDAAELTDTTVTVAVGASDDGATEGTDYATVADLTLTIAAGASSGTATFTITPTGDEVDEEDETVTVGGTVSGFAVTAATVTITDDDTRGIAVSPATLTLNEGSSASYTVVLNSEPTGEVTAAATVGGSGDVSTRPTSLTFTAGNWDEAQTVTVDAQKDADAVSDSATVTHQVSGGDYSSETAGAVAVTVTDTDTASTGITLAVTPATVGESADATNVRVTGTLNHAPELTATTVTVTVGATSDPATEGTDYGTVADLTLTIAAGASSGTATFTITPTGDEVDEEDETVTVGGTASGFTVTAATVTITDDDTRGIALNPATLTVTEDDEASYTVALLSEPTGTVTVTVGGTTNTDLSVEPAALTFSTTAWSTAQTVTVDAGDDDDAVNDSVALTHTAGGGDYGAVSRNLTVTVTDIDTAAPAMTVELGAPVHDDADGSGTVTLGDMLTYTATARNSGNVPLTGVALRDVLVDSSGDECGTLGIGASCQLSGDHTVSQADVDAGTVANTATGTASELTDAVTASVSTAVAQERAVTLVKTAAQEGFAAVGDRLDYSYEVSNSGTVTLTGTASVSDDKIAGAAINCPALPESGLAPGGTVTCEGSYTTVQADVDASGVTNAATATVGGTKSAAVSVRVPWVAPQGSDPRLTLGGASGTEDAGTLAFTVTLDPTSLQTVTVGYATANVTATAGEDYTAATGTLTLAAGAATEAISVAITDDAVDEDDETFTVTLSSPVNAAVASGSVTATITDNDTRGIALNPAALTVTEDGEASYTVALQSKPTGAVTVTVGGATGTDLSVSPVALTFSTTAWSTVQTVTVDAGDDDDAVNDSVALTHTAAGGDYGTVSRNLTVTVTDIDTAAPAMTVELGAPVHDDADGSGTVTLGDMLTYTATARNSGNVPLTGVALRDVLVDSSGDECGTLGIGASCQLNGDHTVSQEDVDAGTVANTATGTASELTDAVTASVSTAVAQERAVTLVKTAAQEGFAAVGDRLDYSYEVSNSGTVTLTGTASVSDDKIAGAAINCPALPESGLAPGGTVTCEGSYTTVQADVDASGVTNAATATVGGTKSAAVSVRVPWVAPQGSDPRLTLGGASGTEDAGTLAFTVTLDPTSLQTVTVGYATANVTAAAGEDYTAATGTLTLAAGAATGAISVAVTDDAVDEDDETFTVTLSSPVNAAVASGSVTATITDNDTRGIALNPAALTVTEDGEASYTVALQSKPTGAVTVTVGGATNTDLSVEPAALTFSTTAWSTAQTVTVDAGEDDDAVNDSVALTHTAGGGDYGAVSRNLTVTVTDIDTAAPAMTVELGAPVHDDADGSGTVTLGDMLTYTATARNSGNVPLTGVALRDVLVDSSGDECGTLGIGASCQLSGDHTVSQEDVDAGTVANTATGTASELTDAVTASVSTAVAQERAVTLVKTAAQEGFAAVGDRLDYSYEVSNSGTVTLTGTASVSDDKIAGAAINCPALPESGLAPGGTVTCEGSYTTVQADVDASGVTNAAAATVGGTKSAAVSVRVPWVAPQGSDPRLTLGGASGTEDAGTLAFTVTLDPTSLQTVTVGYATANVTATAGEDYTAATGTLTLAPGAATGAISVAVTDDAVDEDDETFTVTLSSPVNAAVASGSVTATITDNDTRGIALSPAALGVTEGDEASYTVALQSEPTGTVTVTVGGATNTDLSVEPAALTFSTTAWSTVQTVTVDAGDDDDAVNDSVALTHTAGGGDYGTVSRNLTVTVTDTDTASTGITLAVAPAAVGESADATNVRVTGTLNHAPELTDTTVTVTVGATSDAATEGTDYGTVADLTLTIAAGATSGTATFTITPTGDEVDEEDETVTVGGTVSGFTVTAATVTITDDDTRGIALNPATLTVTEDDEASYTVALLSEPTGTVTVTVGGATNTDLSVEPATLTFSTTAWSTVQTVTVDAGEDDDAVNDSVALTHTAGGGDYGAVSRNLTVTVTDIDTASTGITLAVTPAAVGESADATNVRVTGTLNHAPALTDTTVTVTVGESSDPATEGTDYGTVADLTLTIAAGATSGTATFTITPTGDEVDEEDETVTVGGTASGFTVTAATVTITDDDTRGIALSPAALTVTEDGEASYTVALQSKPTGAVTVTVGGTTNTDLSVSPVALTFSTTGWSTAQTVTVEAGEDADVVNDSATLIHTGAGGDYGMVSRELAVTVTDTDTASTGITLAAAPASVGESAAATSVTVTGTLNHAPALTDTTVTVTVGATSDPATEGTDYATVDDFALTIVAGATSGTASFTFTPVDDTVDETDETVTVGGTAAGVAVTAAALTIIDDDPGTPGSLTIDVEPSSVAEQAGSTPVTVTGTLSPPATQEVEVTVTVTGDTATEGADFAAVANFALTFAAGQASAAASFTLVPIADGVTERIETLKVVGTPSDVALSPIEAIVTITDGAPESDSEAPPTVSITGTGAVNEGQPVRFTVTRTGTATASLTVPVGVSEQGSFLAGAPAEEVRFAAGARSATLTVATADDQTDEPGGSVTATLRAGSGYELGSASATVAVADNDDAPELSIADVRAVESAGMIEFTVHMAAASAFEVSVVCTSEDVTATANEDYEPELGTLVLAPGQTLGTIRVPIMDDMRDEMDETFMMLLSAPVNATLADDEATGTIVDDDESVAAAWLSRFGRTVASHVVDVVGSRLGPGPAPVSQAALAGRRLQSPPGPVPTDLLPVTWSEWEQPAEARRLDFAELLAGSAFDVVAATDGARNAPGGQWTAWGRGGVTHLAGADEHLAVEGQVAGALVGVEYDWGSILAGASAGYHDGRGRVEVAGANGLAPYTEEVESWLVSVHPYVSVEISDRVALWGLLGYGQGSMSLDGGGSSQETPITMTMGAVGGRGLLLSRAESERFRVALKADALLAQMASDEAERLPAAMADAQRLRVVLEGSVDALRGPHGVLTPSLAVGARVDGGTAETGAGLEVGGGLSYAYPPWGLTVAADGRLLVAHEDRGFEQWGAGGSLRVAPGAQGVGPSLTLGTAWGDTTTQVEQLWSQGVGLAGGVDARNALGTSGSLAAELGYGLPAPASAVVTPFVGVALEESGSRTYRVGSRLNVGQSLRLALEAERHESGAAPSSKHVLKLTGTLIW